MDLQPLSDQPLVIDGEKKSEGALAIHTTADQAITVTPTGRWQHQGNVDVHAKQTGLFLEEGAQATIEGKLQSQGQKNQGIYLATNSQLTLKGSLIAEGESSRCCWRAAVNSLCKSNSLQRRRSVYSWMK